MNSFERWFDNKPPKFIRCILALLGIGLIARMFKYIETKKPVYLILFILMLIPITGVFIILTDFVLQVHKCYKVFTRESKRELIYQSVLYALLTFLFAASTQISNDKYMLIDNLPNVLKIILASFTGILFVLAIVFHYVFKKKKFIKDKYIRITSCILTLIFLFVLIDVYVYLLQTQGEFECDHSSAFGSILWPLTWFLNHTIYYIFYGIFWIMYKIMPGEYTGVVTEFKTLFWNGIVATMEISLFGTILGLVIAIIFGSLRTMKVKPKDKWIVKVFKKTINGIIKVYVTIFRGTPMIVQAMIIYYGFLKIFNWQPFDAAMVTVIINTGAYLTEVIHSGIESVDIGQYEASRSLGFSYFKTMLLIVFPQALKNSMAAIGNEFVINIKDTSVLNVIGCVEMYYVLKISSGKTYFYTETMISGALIYLLLTYSTTKLLQHIEKKLEVPTKELPGSN
ncbi:MAG: amino acid ABC transporter permease [Acholeplasmatales bacterium]|nr:amino acid ABC transporter permease [Acholeplasmatales bacterium]